MTDYCKIFAYRTPNREKLLALGFSEEGGALIKTQPLVAGFTLRLRIEGDVRFFVYDDEAESIYTLHLVEGAGGEFVGGIREALNKALTEIAERGFERIAFRTPLACEIARYTSSTFGESPDYPWADDFEDAVLRRSDNRKWYAGIFSVKGSKVGLPLDERTEIINLRVNGERREEYLAREGFVPAWHMNKTHWITVLLNGSVSLNELLALVTESREMAKGKKRGAFYE